MDIKEKIFIVGNGELVALALEKNLKNRGYKKIFILSDDKLNLKNNEVVANYFKSEKPDYIFLPSYKSGSIQANIKYPAEFIYNNLIVQNNIIHNAYLNNVKKLLFFGASCVYPKESLQPIKEEYFLNGELESTSRAYSVSKIAGIEMCRAYNKQYGAKFISVIPATLYGPGDKFDLENSHVLSAFIRKFYEAKIKNDKEITLWGSGEPRREFLYVDDLVEACIFLMENDFDIDLINIGSGEDFEIKELAEKVKNIVGFNGKIIWDTSKPDGQKQKLLDSNRLHLLNWHHKIELEDGINKTYKWFLENIKISG